MAGMALLFCGVLLSGDLFYYLSDFCTRLHVLYKSLASFYFAWLPALARVRNASLLYLTAAVFNKNGIVRNPAKFDASSQDAETIRRC